MTFRNCIYIILQRVKKTRQNPTQIVLITIISFLFIQIKPIPTNKRWIKNNFRAGSSYEIVITTFPFAPPSPKNRNASPTSRNG